MYYISIFVVSFSIALSGALMPGPLLTLVVSESARKGFIAGPLIILGHMALEIAMVILIVMGLAAYINNPAVLSGISIAGGCILIYFGARMLKSRNCRIPDADTGHMKSAGLIRSGVIMSIANPYWTIWWLTIGLGLVLGAGKQGFAGIGVFFAGHILADFLWYGVVAYAVSRGRKIISQRYERIIVICAVLLIAFGIYFVAQELVNRIL